MSRNHNTLAIDAQGRRMIDAAMAQKGLMRRALADIFNCSDGNVNRIMRAEAGARKRDWEEAAKFLDIPFSKLEKHLVRYLGKKHPKQTADVVPPPAQAPQPSPPPSDVFSMPKALSNGMRLTDVGLGNEVAVLVVMNTRQRDQLNDALELIR